MQSDVVASLPQGHWDNLFCHRSHAQRRSFLAQYPSRLSHPFQVRKVWIHRAFCLWERRFPRVNIGEDGITTVWSAATADLRRQGCPSNLLIVALEAVLVSATMFVQAWRTGQARERSRQTAGEGSLNDRYELFTIFGVKKISSSCFATASLFDLKSHPKTGMRER